MNNSIFHMQNTHLPERNRGGFPAPLWVQAVALQEAVAKYEADTAALPDQYAIDLLLRCAAYLLNRNLEEGSAGTCDYVESTLRQAARALGYELHMIPASHCLLRYHLPLCPHYPHGEPDWEQRMVKAHPYDTYGFLRNRGIQISQHPLDQKQRIRPETNTRSDMEERERSS